jgi:hypothetical protein
MTANAYSLSPTLLSIRRVGASVWIFRLLESLERRTVTVLRDAFRDAIDRDASDVVVDFALAEEVSTEGAAALVEMAGVMRGRCGALWIAAPTGDGHGYTLRAVHQTGPDGMLGVTPALDGALTGAQA